MSQIYPGNYKFTWKDVPKVGTWVENMVPSIGSVIMFGPAGTGKTTLAANMLNSVITGQQFLGRMTSQTNGMLLSLDTPKNILVRRWLESKPPFDNHFSFAAYDPFDCLHPDFKKSNTYKEIKDHVKDHHIRLVAVDSLRDCFHGELTNDEMPKEVYGTFQEWFSGATVIFLHHTRKQQFVNGKPLEGNIDDEATGSKFWINKAQVALYLRKQNNFTLRLDMGKSQCFAPWNEPIQISVNDMEMEEFDDQKATGMRQQFNAAVSYLSSLDMKWSSYKVKEQVELVAQHLKITERQAWRMRAASRN